jgi:hypothetical protein
MEKIDPKRLSPDKGFVVGISAIIGVDDPKIEIEYEPAQAKAKDQVQKIEFYFYAGETELIRAEMHKFVDDTIDNLYGNP